MIFKTIVPKLGEAMYYLGKPVFDTKNNRIGSITEVKEDGDCLEVFMDIDDKFFKEEKENKDEDN